ncbi:MAG: tRNA (adenosine(37)-N6)-threonylcarbamoyltransferase complex ATPase subunit type 1 TsaE [Verrucomicrobia bacterium]|nr:tRNA (adenosine(37)-N6)-threonylcarbamoyltransferase complex ATPase subunit type 1 TsaE [Verrucomicrobiota bacterium]
MRGHLYVDGGGSGRPGVLVFPEAFGLSEHAKLQAERLAHLGYVGLACDLHGEGKLLSDREAALAIIKELSNDAAEFARHLPAGTVLSLTGDLGAGKTEFVKGLALGLGTNDEVTSPTFTLVQRVQGGRLALFHMDFYRLNEEGELDELGFEDYLAAGGVSACRRQLVAT